MSPRRLFPLLAVFAPGAFANEGFHFFESKVRPLLVEKCYDCHAEDKKIKGGLRLDLKEGWEKGGDAGPSIIPGEPDKSLLITAVRYQDHDLQMPPKKKLSGEEIAILEKWVAMGAPDPRKGAMAKSQTGMTLEEGKKFWCYSKPKPTAVPKVQNEEWPKSDIDRFLLAKAEAAGMRPAKDATPVQLVRRIYYSLIGLPPTPAEIDRFVAACSSDRSAAVEQLVDTLLASKHFGERWGRHWLDLARFAESSGGGRTLLFKDAWRYRDYVIEAINADVPIDRFISEQLAGDLFPWKTAAERRRNLTATAFLALGPTNYEEQYKQQLRFDIIDEQLETLGRAFLGQTIGCARCHDHKFDPISQRDYYAMAGILASTRTLFNYTDNVARWIVAPLPGDGADEAAIQAHEAKVAQLQAKLDQAKATLKKFAKAVSEETPVRGKAIPKTSLPGIVIDDSEAKVVGQWKHSQFVRTYIGQGYLSDENSGKGEKTITFTPVLPMAGRYELRLAYTHSSHRANNVRVTVFHADGEDNVYVDQSTPPPIDGRFVSLGKFRFEKDGAGYVLVTNEDTVGYVTVDALQFLPEGEPVAAEVASDRSNPERAEAEKQVKELERELKKLTKSGPAREMAMSVHDDPEIGDTQIRVRGIEKQRGETVPRGFMQVALTNPQPQLSPTESGRREMAEWIASEDNPLTGRVLVNRVWTWLFGTGIVRTVDNFGTTGEKPSHPELLDYLAVRFTSEGWSLKKLVKEIVLSRTWQLEAQPPQASDPENRLFMHANRRRLDAEQLRDTILAVSGQLSLDYLGPNIAGAGDIDANNFSAQNVEYGYVFTDTRRSVYTPAFRNKRLELFEAFDFGDINQPTGQRSVSTVAPQALYLLNHPFVVEQAKSAAERTLAEAQNDRDRIVLAFRKSIGREPSSEEMEKVTRFLGQSASLEAWAQVHQALYGCIDFRYID